MITGTLFVTGTGTGVGKTIVTAAIAALSRSAGRRVAVVKLAQTGVQPGKHSGPGSDTPDLETVTRLSGVTDTHELARFPDPLSPEAAARVSGLPPVDFARAAALIADLAETRDLVLVEGAGGLLVRYDDRGATIADLAPTVLHAMGLPVPDDMDGRVLSELFADGRRVETEAARGSDSDAAVYTAEEEAAIEASLRGLGYIE